MASKILEVMEICLAAEGESSTEELLGTVGVFSKAAAAQFSQSDYGKFLEVVHHGMSLVLHGDIEGGVVNSRQLNALFGRKVPEHEAEIVRHLMMMASSQILDAGCKALFSTLGDSGRSSDVLYGPMWGASFSKEGNAPKDLRSAFLEAALLIADLLGEEVERARKRGSEISLCRAEFTAI